MTVEEIFNKIASHMLEGLKYHDEMAKLYDFLGLYGYSICQSYHFIKETESYRHLSHYYSSHYLKFLVIENVASPKLIPEAWHKYSTIAVDTGTKRNTVKELISKWIEWEKSTKKLYQEMKRALEEIDEIAATLYIDKLIAEVDKELQKAQKELIKLETLGYDIYFIIDEQNKFYHKYKKKLGW